MYSNDAFSAMKMTYIDTGGMTDKEMCLSLSVRNEKVFGDSGLKTYFHVELCTPDDRAVGRAPRRARMIGWLKFKNPAALRGFSGASDESRCRRRRGRSSGAKEGWPFERAGKEGELVADHDDPDYSLHPYYSPHKGRLHRHGPGHPAGAVQVAPRS